MMKGKAELGFVSVDTNPPRLTEDTPFDLTIRIENTGTGEAKQVSATIDLPGGRHRRKPSSGRSSPATMPRSSSFLKGQKAGTIPIRSRSTIPTIWATHTITRQMNLRVPPDG